MTAPAWLSGVTPTGHPYEPAGAWGIYASRITGYMHRWILKTPWGMLRIHRILRSDADPDPHDHPFDFTSVLLRGGYTEVRATGVGADGDPQWTARRYRAGAVLHRRATDAHRLDDVLPGTLTLVHTGPKVKPWGYHTPKGWIPWRTYHRVSS